MNAAEFPVCFPAAISFFCHLVVSGNPLAVTVAATASPTFVGGRDSGTLHCSKQGFVFLGVNGTDLTPNPYRQVECPGILIGLI